MPKRASASESVRELLDVEQDIHATQTALLELRRPEQRLLVQTPADGLLHCGENFIHAIQIRSQVIRLAHFSSARGGRALARARVEIECQAGDPPAPNSNLLGPYSTLSIIELDCGG